MHVIYLLASLTFSPHNFNHLLRPKSKTHQQFTAPCASDYRALSSFFITYYLWMVLFLKQSTNIHTKRQNHNMLSYKRLKPDITLPHPRGVGRGVGMGLHWNDRMDFAHWCQWQLHKYSKNVHCMCKSCDCSLHSFGLPPHTEGMAWLSPLPSTL